MTSKVKLLIDEENKFQGKANCRSHTKTAISTIKAKFSQHQLQRFEASCFGHLLHIEDLKWSPQIVHRLLLRKAHPTSVTQVDGIKFILGNKLIQFTAQQFCLITGLRFGNLPRLPVATNENCPLKSKYFRQNKGVSLFELETAFNDCTDDDDVVKLGFLYFAVFVLLGCDKHVNIDMRYLMLVENLEAFDKYPWGAVSYAKTNSSLLRALSADYHRVKVAKKGKKNAKRTMASGRAREYHINGFAYAFQIWAFEVFPALATLHYVVHEDSALLPRILHWRCNTGRRFHELMSLVFENREVEVKLVRPTEVEKQQPYWSWGDDEDEEDIVEVFAQNKSFVQDSEGGDEGQENTTASIEEVDEEDEETSTLPLSAKGHSKLTRSNLRKLKRDLKSTKDQLAKVASSNGALRKRVCHLEEMVQKECLKNEKLSLKNKKAMEGFTKTLASMEAYFKQEMDELKKGYCVSNEPVQGHEEGCSPRMYEGGENDMSPLHDPMTPTTNIERGEASTHERTATGANEGVDKGPDVTSDPVENAITDATRSGEGDGLEGSATMNVQGDEMEAQLNEKPVEQEAAEVPALEDVVGCKVVSKKVLQLLEDSKNISDQGLGGQIKPDMMTGATVAANEETEDGTGTFEQVDAEGKGCRKKRLASASHKPFTDPVRKKRTVTVSVDSATPTRFDPTKPVPIEDVKALILFCTAWKSNISAELQLEAFPVETSFFYKLIDATAWMSSKHIDMATFLIRKRQFCHPMVFGTNWTTADYHIQQFLDPVKPAAKKRGGKKKIPIPVTVNLPPHCIQNVHHFVQGTWQHGYAQAWSKVRKVYVPYNLRGCHWVALEIDFANHTVTVYDSYSSFTRLRDLAKYLTPISNTLARVLYDMHFYERSEVEEVKKRAIENPNFMPFTMCTVGDVPQQADGAPCGIMTVKCIECLSAGIPLHTIDPSKCAYYRLKLAIEALREEAYL